MSPRSTNRRRDAAGDDPVALSELVRLRRGASYKSALLGPDGVALLGLGTLERHGGFKGSNVRFYCGEAPERMLVRTGDLFVSLKDMTHEAALLGAVARVPPEIAVARLTQDTIALDLIAPNRVNPEFLYWQLRTPRYRAYCRAHGTGTTNLDLSQENFLSFEFALPSVPEQGARVRVLSALDDKIAANRKVVRRADDLRRAQWRQAAQSSPSVALSSVARFVNGKAFTKNASGAGRMVIRIADLRSGPGASTVYNDIRVEDDHIARPGDLLMAWSGSLMSARWHRDEAIVNQHIFKVVPQPGNPLWAVACAVDSKIDAFVAIAATKATTMGHIQRHHLDEPVSWPNLSDVERKAGETLWDRALAAERENEALAATRDELLPLLMSGRITVKDAERRVEDET